MLERLKAKYEENEREQQFLKNLTELDDQIDAHNERFKANSKELLLRILQFRQFATRPPINPVTTSNEDPMRTTVIPPTATPTDTKLRKKTMTDIANKNSAIEEETIFFYDESEYPNDHDDDPSDEEYEAFEETEDDSIIPTTQQNKK